MEIIKVINQTLNLVELLSTKVNKSEIDWLTVEEEILRFINMIGSLIEQEILEKVVEPTLDNKLKIDGSEYYFSEMRNLTFINRFGKKISKVRRCYKKINSSGSFSPLDEKLGFTNSKGFSPFMSYLLSVFGCNQPFNESSQRLSKTIGFEVSGTAVQSNTEHIGNLIPSAPHDFLDSELQSEPCELMITEVDGTTSPQIKEIEAIEKMKGKDVLKLPTEYKECNLIAIEKHIGYKKEKVYGGLYSSREDFREYAREFGICAGQLNAKVGVFIGDGLASNWILAQDYFPNFIHILDFYHASEHLYSFGRLFQDEKVGKNEAERWKGMIYEGEIYEVIDEMKKTLKKIDVLKLDDAEREIKYFETNKERMHYLEYRNKNFPIGSGMIEAACKLVVCKRFKGNGMRWRRKDNIKVLKTRLSYLNGDLHKYYRGNIEKWVA